MNNMKTVFKIYREIQSLEKKVLPAVTVQSIISSLKPFINILFTAKIINLLSDGKDFKTVMLYITIAVAVNFILFFLGSFLDEYSQNLRNLLLNKENKKVASKLFGTEYQKTANIKSLFTSTRKPKKADGLASPILYGQHTDF